MRGGGACAVLLMFLLLVGSSSVAALCFEESPNLSSLEAEAADVIVLRDDYPKLELSLQEGLTAAGYAAFIAQLRQRLLDVSNERAAWEVPVLTMRDSVHISRRFVLVDVTNYAGETVTLAIDVVNAYIVGYRVGDRSFFTRPDNDDNRNAIAHVFVGTQRQIFTFTGSYVDLLGAAVDRTTPTVLTRLDITLGRDSLHNAVRSMYLYAAGRPTPALLHSVARGLVVCVQMISEAARFRYIEGEIRSRIQTNVESAPDPSVVELENSWSSLSSAIELSNDDGTFVEPITVQRRDYSKVSVNTVRTIRPYIALLLFVCRPHPNNPGAATTTTTTTRQLIVTSSDDDDPTCPPPVEHTWRIVGAGGLCVDVKGGYYNNGDPVQLWPCKSNDDVNQLWTFRSDGTLRSNGKCLASYGDKPRTTNYIMIYDCNPQVPEFIWHSWPNGTIVSACGLVLSASSSASGTELKAMENAFSTGQSWLPTNATVPHVHQIAGFSRIYCLHAEGEEDVVLRGCGTEEWASWWALYPDGSIRPASARHLCVAPPDTQVGQPLKMVSCNPNSSLQRWLFGNDGTMIHLSTDLVVDVQGSTAFSGARLILNALAGTATQEWLPLL